ncbi:restriction endonuclease subunit S [Veillonella sp. T11011-6]|uniref:restriction endonuclease subunit S n=1 Tax=Veillonella sp. T11011-6 TaxID=2027459 RepID=UPI000CF4B4EE|nr:restriction endonuclease subunit S [Veillonella sp. T11011-6]PQL10376.1 restriction endonuclease subunit S [Veillonella sp. T11011-6]
MIKLRDVASYVSEKVDIGLLKVQDYITTDNMLSNRGGIIIGNDLPKADKVTKFERGDILVSNIRPYFKKIWYATFNGGCSNDVIVFRANGINSKFLYYVLSQNAFFDYMMAGANGTKMPRGNKNLIPDFELLNFSPVQQEHISSILSTFDSLIENNQKQIKLLEEAAQRLYKEWFIDLRFPGNENVDIVDGVPERWNINCADHYFKITIGKTPSRAEKQWFTNSGEGTPWISISDMGEAGVFCFYSKEDLTADAIVRHNMKVVPKGSILVSFKLTVGRVAITGVDMCTNEAIAHFYIDNDLDRAYTYCYLKNFEYDSLGNTSSISKAINSKIIKSMPFIMPTRDILERFSLIVQPILDQIEFKQIMIFRLTEARNRLLPKLMSGEIEV